MLLAGKKFHTSFKIGAFHTTQSVWSSEIPSAPLNQCHLLIGSAPTYCLWTCLQRKKVKKPFEDHNALHIINTVVAQSCICFSDSNSLLWITICSNFLLLEALSNIFWSMVLAVIRRYTTTGLVWPMRWQRSWACRSAWGFWERRKTQFHQTQ